MKFSAVVSFLLLITFPAFSQKVSFESPDHKIKVGLFNQENGDMGTWYLKLDFRHNGQYIEVIPRINLGLSRSDQDFADNLIFLKSGKPSLIREEYQNLHGKRSQCYNTAYETVVSFENPGKAKMNLIIRVYTDGVTFRYEFPEDEGSFLIEDELTSFLIPEDTRRWLEKFDLSNEGLYIAMNDASQQQNWCYPALFSVADTACWFLLHEADVNRSYCATKLSNTGERSVYKLAIPHPEEGEGEALPTINLPWKSPWRVIMMGSLADIVESTLVDDVSTPSILTETDWIKPGLVSWNYWSDNHGTKDYQTVCRFADLAADMDWPYTLLDWEWDSMGNGGSIEDAAAYILSKGVKPLVWYNSGMFKWITATPVDRMKTHESRMEEFRKLKEMGFAGVKIDFFLSEKQYMIDYYLDILEDAAHYELMVYFHGCLVPRGWARTYPHLMTYEGVRGAEWYNNGPDLTASAPEHNTILPFTRNVVGSMDYTPVTFTNSQFPHTTSYGHELALSVVFESGLQHMADRPEGYYGLPDAARNFLREVPCSWDQTKFISGYPGRDIVLARRKGDNWYIAGISSAWRNETIQNVNLDFLQEGVSYKLTLVSDGEHDKALETRYEVVDNKSNLEVKLLRRGGFAASLRPIQP